jgi:Rps23 Pro-64 3,4-dihydroxylase Tpa1-like proline 4-hydroxylase
MNTIGPIAAANLFHFNADDLAILAQANKAAFASNQPFPHIVIDDFLPAYVLDQVLAELPPVPLGDDNETGKTRASERYKTARPEPEFFGPITTHLLYQLNAGPFLDFLESLTGISGLISDLRLDGGGYHLTRRGGRLGIHTDFSHHRKSKMRRKLNMILYLNKDWKDEYGGHLELWDKDLTKCYERVLPIFNRCVIFATDAGSPHGQPDPLMCPPDRGRQSLALYYFTNEADQAEHVGTRYMNRPNDESLLRRLLPPILYDAVKRAKRQGPTLNV